METNLEMAQRHVREGRGHIDRQIEIISKLRECGLPTAEAEAMLATFEASQQLHEAHLARLQAS